MARREAVTEGNDTNTRARNRRRPEPEKVALPSMGVKVALPEKFRTARGEEFVGTGRSTAARVRESRCVRRAEARLAARQAAWTDKPGHHKPGSRKYR